MIVHIRSRRWFCRLSSLFHAFITYCCSRGIFVGWTNSSLSHTSLFTILIWTWYCCWFLGASKWVSDGSSRLILHISNWVSIITSRTRSSIYNFRCFHSSRHWIFSIPLDKLFMRPRSIIRGDNRVIVIWGNILYGVVNGSHLCMGLIRSSRSHSETASTRTWTSIFHY